VDVKRAGHCLVGLVGTAVLSGCSPDLFETAELITVTETSTQLVPTSTVITSVTNPVSAMLGDGVFEVGEDVAAGRYATIGAPQSGGICVWSLLPYEDAPVEKAVSGGFTEGPGQLTVSLGDIIQTRGGCDWRLVP
jgi:hypothetical protein